MKHQINFLLLIIALFAVQAAQAQTTEFNYQGSLKDGANAANGNYDIQIDVYTAETGGTYVTFATFPNVAVNNGIFSVKLDLGAGVFPGVDRWLSIKVKPAGSPNPYTVLAPRQRVNSVPYAIFSLNTAQLGGVAANEYLTTTNGNANYIQNTASFQTANFNISGNGSANILNAATEYRLAGNKFLSGGINNVFAGVNAGNLNTGDFNSFVGSGAGYNTMGNSNSFVGASAGFANTTGGLNSFFGYAAGERNTMGGDNLFIGAIAGFDNTTGGKNTIIGKSANVASGNLFNATAIGSYSLVSQSNSLILGSINGINGAFADTNVGIGTTSPTNRLSVVGTADFSGNVGIGTGPTTFKLHVNDASNTGIRVQTNIAGGTVASFGGAGAFRVDAPGIGGGRLVILENGNVGIGNPNPADRLNVNGNISMFLGSGGTTQLCQNAAFQIATCGSSIRYKQNINPFNPGLSLINRLRPITFDWKEGGMHDLGLGAEDVAAIEPLLVTYNAKGEIEGVKYDRVGVVLVNAVKEQQTQIEALKKEIDELRQIVCQLKPTGKGCSPR